VTAKYAPVLCAASPREYFEILKGMGHLFQRFGGHSAAAGLTMEYDKLEAFENGMNESLRLVPPESLFPALL
jgi:single-stranded DNA-specific DHH superfamily exonuclease